MTLDTSALLDSSEIHKYIDQRLEAWGKWARNDGSHKLWFPSRSILAQVMDNGFSTPGTSSPCPHPANPECEEIDGHLNFFKVFYPWESATIFAYYVDKKSKDKIAKEHEVGIATVYNRIRHAKIWLEGRLSMTY